MSNQMSLFEASFDKPQLPKHIRLIEFFAGIGAQAKALEVLNADFEHWRTCEWSWQSITAYNAIHMGGKIADTSDLTYEEVLTKINGVSADYNQPMSEKQLRSKGEKWARELLGRMIVNGNVCPNVSNLHAKDLDVRERESNTYIVTYSFPCGLPNEKVKTSNGYKNIQNVSVGDMVLTHEGRYRKVVDVMTKEVNEYYEVKALGTYNLRLTGNHPLYVLRDEKLQWIPVSLLKKGDFITYNVNKESVDCELTNDELWLLGRYVADGFINKYHYNSVAFAIGWKKEDEFKSKCPKKYIEKAKKYKKTCWEYRIADKNLHSLCEQFGNGAKNKTIPQWVINLPKDRLEMFIEGYLSGDGHIRYRKNIKQIMFSTASECLALAIQDCFIKLYKAIPTISIRHDNRKETFNDTYNGQLNITSIRNKQKFDGKYAYGYVYGVNKIEEETPVFNLSVEEDNSYTISNIISHNCQDLSAAGQMKGMERGSNTRSGLLWEVERILLECQEDDSLPQVLVMENVPLVVSQANLKPWNEWLDALEHMGYTNYWKIINAKDYGIPQNRRRCFMVSILGEYSYSFPKPMELKYLLKDFIDKKVDESYYLSDELVKGFEEYTKRNEENGNGFAFEPNNGECVGKTVLTRAGQRPCDNYLEDEYDNES